MHGFRVGGDVNQMLVARHRARVIIAAEIAAPSKKRHQQKYGLCWFIE